MRRRPSKFRCVTSQGKPARSSLQHIPNGNRCTICISGLQLTTILPKPTFIELQSPRHYYYPYVRHNRIIHGFNCYLVSLNVRHCTSLIIFYHSYETFITPNLYWPHWLSICIYSSTTHKMWLTFHHCHDHFI